MPTAEIVWYTILLAAVFFAVSTVLLRLSCNLANWLGPKARLAAPIRVPDYKTCLSIVFVTVFVLGLLNGLAQSVVTWCPEGTFDGAALRATAWIVQWLLFAALIAGGLRTEQRAPWSWTLLAASLCLIALLALGRGVVLLGSLVGPCGTA